MSHLCDKNKQNSTFNKGEKRFMFQSSGTHNLLIYYPVKGGTRLNRILFSALIHLHSERTWTQIGPDLSFVIRDFWTSFQSNHKIMIQMQFIEVTRYQTHYYICLVCSFVVTVLWMNVNKQPAIWGPYRTAVQCITFSYIPNRWALFVTLVIFYFFSVIRVRLFVW